MVTSSKHCETDVQVKNSILKSCKYLISQTEMAGYVVLHQGPEDVIRFVRLKSQNFLTKGGHMKET